MLIMSVMLILLFASTCVATEYSFKEHLFVMTEDNGIAFTENLLSTMSVESGIKCGSACSQTADCKFFTFTKTSPSSGTCRLHSEAMNVTSPHTSTPGSSAYSDVPLSHGCPRHPGDRMRTIQPDSGPPITVYCDADPDPGGWTVIQRHSAGSSTSFNRNWAEYEAGFGDLEADFWLGLTNMHRMTTSTTHSLLVELEDFNGATAYALYETFYIEDASQNYKLRLSGYSGTAGDSLMNSGTGNPSHAHNNMPFSTPDRDNDACPDCHCGSIVGWWYNWCASSNLNNLYEITWYSWKDSFEALKRSTMKIRPTA